MTIFVSIASYEDPSLLSTVKTAIHNAKFPNDIVFGICFQYSQIDEPKLDFLKPEQLRSIRYDPKNRPGIYRVRSEIASLMKDEDYFLQVDSHTVFSPDWDEQLMFKLESIKKQFGNDRVAISVAKSHRVREDGLWPVQMPKMFIEILNERDGHYSWMLRESDVVVNSIDRPTKVNMFICNMIFADRRLVGDGIFRQSLEWANGEQSFLSFCAYLAGWDIFVIPNNPIIHDDSEYNKVRPLLSKSARWYGEVDYNYNRERDVVSDRLVNGFDPSSGLKIKRSIQDFWEYLGGKDYLVHIKNRGKCGKQ